MWAERMELLVRYQLTEENIVSVVEHGRSQWRDRGFMTSVHERVTIALADEILALRVENDALRAARR